MRLYRLAKQQWDGRSERFRNAILFSFVAGGLAAWLLPIAQKRLIDGDEGYLLMAARLVSEGRWPYRDFFFTQAPLVPALFGLLFWGIARSWLVARLLAGLMAVGMGLLVYRETLSATQRRTAALLATALFGLSGSTIGWLSIVKGYGLSALLLLASALLVGSVVRRSATPGTRHHAALAAGAAGLTVGLAASARLYTIVVMPALALCLLSNSGINRASARRIGWFALGCLLGLLPLLGSYAIAGQAFWFDTFLYHGVREYGQASLFGTAKEKLPSILESMGLDSQATYWERQWMVSAMLATLALGLRIGLRKPTNSAAAWVWPVLIGVSVLPNPFLPQYLCLPLPFLAIEGGRLLDLLLDRWFCRRLSRWPVVVVAFAAACLGYHARVAQRERSRFIRSGIDVPGVESSDRVTRWRIETVEAATRAIDAQRIPVGASWWPGYFVSTRTSLAVELANDFGFRAASVLSPEDRHRFHVVSLSEVGDMIRRRQPRLFVEGNWAAYPWAKWLPENGYRARRTIENVRVWTVE